MTRVMGRPSGSILCLVVYALLLLRARRAQFADQQLRLARANRGWSEAAAEVDGRGNRTKRQLYRTGHVRGRGHELAVRDAGVGRVRRREWPGRCGT
jgi:hypothetical protein